jgi:rRNA pseudouridine-1189 N-methylase Emg1 (Nep1/Mra1 family)
LTSEETRDISLGAILTGEEPTIIKTTDIRKIDVIVNKEKALMEAIAKTILDENRHHLTIIEWSCQKTGEKLRIRPDDFKDLLDMKLSDILSKIEN